MTIVCTPEEQEALIFNLTELNAQCVLPGIECPEDFHVSSYKTSCKECLMKNIRWVMTDVNPLTWFVCPVCGDNELDGERGYHVCKNCHTEIYEHGAVVTTAPNTNKGNVT